MKKRIAVVVLGLLFVGSILILDTIRSQSLPSPLSIRYESGVIFGQQGESVAAIAANLDTVSHTFRIKISQQQGNPFVTVFDSGSQTVAAGSAIGNGFIVPLGIVDNFLVEITTDSEKVVPSVVAQAPCSSIPCPTPRFWLHGSQLAKFKQEF